MTVRGIHITVTTSATLLTPAADSGSNGKSVWITVGSTDIWIHGVNDVDTSGSKGRKVLSGTDLTMDLNTGENLYGVVASGTSVCEVLEQGVE